MMERVVSNKFRWMSFISAILIAIAHLSQAYNADDIPIMHFYQKLGEPAMVYFFLSTAYFRYRNYDIKDYLPKLKKRVITLLIPYVCWNLIAYFICVYEGFYEFSFINMLKLLVFFYVPGADIVHDCALVILWFIIRILTYEMVSPLFFFIIRRKAIFGAVVILVTLINIFGNVNYYAFLFWVPIYLIGAYLAYHYHEQLETLWAKSALKGTGIKRIGSNLTALAIYVIVCLLMMMTPLHYFIMKLAFIPLIMVSMYFLSVSDDKITWLVAHGSFFLYCVHVPLKWLFSKQLTIYFGEKCGMFYAAHIYMLITISLAFVIGWILYKICPKLFHLLTGGR